MTISKSVVLGSNPSTPAMNKVLLYTSIFIVGFIGVSLWAFWLITHPPKIIIGTTPKTLGLKYEDIELKTEDGLALSAWFIPIPNHKLPTSALILIHGYPAEKADLLPLAKVLSTKYSILLFDMRSFGKSEGGYTTLGKYELLDLEAALDFLESRGYDKIGVFGFSLGGAVGIMKSDDPRIYAVASYAGFSNLRLLGHEAYKNLWVLKYPLVELLAFWNKIFFDYDIDALSPQNVAAKTRKPIFIIHNKEDEQISFAHAEGLKEALKNNPKAQFYFEEGGAHGLFPDNFDELILDFFIKNLD